MNRRHFLKASALTIVGLAADPSDLSAKPPVAVSPVSFLPNGQVVGTEENVGVVIYNVDPSTGILQFGSGPIPGAVASTVTLHNNRIYFVRNVGGVNRLASAEAGGNFQSIEDHFPFQTQTPPIIQIPLVTKLMSVNGVLHGIDAVGKVVKFPTNDSISTVYTPPSGGGAFDLTSNGYATVQTATGGSIVQLTPTGGNVITTFSNRNIPGQLVVAGENYYVELTNRGYFVKGSLTSGAFINTQILPASVDAAHSGSSIQYFNGNRVASVDIGTVLAIEMKSFAVAREKDGAHLTWITASETENSHFVVERRNHGETAWQEIGSISGSGTTLEEKKYTFQDRETPQGLAYYRIAAVDYDGKKSYSNIQSIAENDLNQKAVVYPNSTSGPITLDLGRDVTSGNPKLYRIFNVATGRLEQTVPVTGQVTKFDVSGLSSGPKIIRAADGAGPALPFLKL